MMSDLQRLDSDVQHQLHKLSSMAKIAAKQAGSRYAALELIGHAANDSAVFQKVASAISPDMADVPLGEFQDRAPNLNHPLCKQYKNVESLIKEANAHKDGVRLLETNKQRLIAEMNV